MAEEKWFEFVARMKKEQNLDSLAKAMKYASANKNKWQKGGNTEQTIQEEPFRKEGRKEGW